MNLVRKTVLKGAISLVLGPALAIAIPEVTWFLIRQIGPVATLSIITLTSVNTWLTFIAAYIPVIFPLKQEEK